MGLILHPQNSFTVVRQIANHTDATTYYVRAVIRNAYTDAIIDTLDLTSRGSQRFSKNWQVPADVSGQGFYISIVTSVYTDSGYTTKSENYGDEETTYLVQNRIPLGGAGGGGGGGIDARTVRRIIQEELEKVKPEPITIPKPKEYEMRWDDVLKAIARVGDEVAKVPKEAVDMKPVLKALGDVKRVIVDKPVTPPTDLTKVVDAVADVRDLSEKQFKEIMEGVETLSDETKALAIRTVRDLLTKTKMKMTFTTAMQKDTPETKEEEEPSIFDIKSFAR